MDRDNPADRCPYARPLRPDFRDCAAFQRADVVVVDTHFTPLTSVTACAHVQVGESRRGAFYASCRLGDAASRAAWVERVRADRVELARGLQSEMSERFAAATMAVWTIKARQLEARAGGLTQREQRLTEELRAAVTGLIADMVAFLKDNSRVLDRLGAPVELCRELYERVGDDWVDAGTLAPPPLPEDIVARFPPEGRLLIDPAAPAA